MRNNITLLITKLSNLIKKMSNFVLTNIRIVIALIIFIILSIFHPLLCITLAESIPEVQSESLFTYKRLIYACIFGLIVTTAVIGVIAIIDTNIQINEYNNNNFLYNDSVIILDNNVKVYDSTNFTQMYKDKLFQDRIDLNLTYNIQVNPIDNVIYYTQPSNVNELGILKNTILNNETYYRLPKHEQLDYYKAFHNVIQHNYNSYSFYGGAE